MFKPLNIGPSLEQEPVHAKTPAGGVKLSRAWQNFLNELVGLVKKHGTIEATVVLAEVAAASCAEQNVSVTGVKTDMVFDVKPKVTDGVGVVGAYCAAADTLTVVGVNPTAGAITPGTTSITLDYWRR